jgi:hypothetical protein
MRIKKRHSTLNEMENYIGEEWVNEKEVKDGVN